MRLLFVPRISASSAKESAVAKAKSIDSVSKTQRPYIYNQIHQRIGSSTKKKPTASFLIPLKKISVIVLAFTSNSHQIHP